MMGTAFLGYIIISPKWLEIYNNEYLIVTSALLPLTPSLKLQEILSKNNLKPLRTWENLHQDGVKKAVQTRVKDIMGIYAIVNLVTGDLYVGSAVKGRMRNRFHKHLFGGTGSIITYAAVLKYGLSNFAFVILESVEGSVNDDNNKELLMREDYYLSTLLPMYNIAPKVGNTLGVKHTNETKHKMKINYSSERREAIGALNRGKTLTPETVEAIRQAALNRAPISDETR
jgi:group I intron endonuclease